MSPTPALGSLFNRPRIPYTAITKRFLAPVLSAQLITAPTGRPREMRNLAPDAPPRPLLDILPTETKIKLFNNGYETTWIRTTHSEQEYRQ